MEDPPGSYAPRSPDLSALTAASSSYSRSDEIGSGMPGMNKNGSSSTGPFLLPPQTSQPSSYPPPPHHPARRDSYSSSPSSYYQPPPLLQQQVSSSYGYSQFAYPPPMQQPMSPQVKQLKTEPDDNSWPAAPLQSLQSPATGLPSSSKKGPRGSGGAAALKPEEPPEPRVPPPGELEGVVVRTKFPVARIKRIVQADDEVGKVAQATPVAVGKALELFMIHVTLASASIATGGAAFGDNKGGGSKRITKTHIKSAILKHDEFDFLRPIAEKIPDGPGGSGKNAEGKEVKGRGGKMESDEDGDADLDDGDDEGDTTYGSKSKRPANGRERSSRRTQRGMG